MRIGTETTHMSLVEMLEHQSRVPMARCEGAQELLGNYLCIVPIKVAIHMFLLGYIEGKRVERARRKENGS